MGLIPDSPAVVPPGLGEFGTLWLGEVRDVADIVGVLDRGHDGPLAYGEQAVELPDVRADSARLPVHVCVSQSGQRVHADCHADGDFLEGGHPFLSQVICNVLLCISVYTWSFSSCVPKRSGMTSGDDALALLTPTRDITVAGDQEELGLVVRAH